MRVRYRYRKSYETTTRKASLCSNNHSHRSHEEWVSGRKEEQAARICHLSFAHVSSNRRPCTQEGKSISMSMPMLLSATWMLSVNTRNTFHADQTMRHKQKSNESDISMPRDVSWYQTAKMNSLSSMVKPERGTSSEVSWPLPSHSLQLLVARDQPSATRSLGPAQTLVSRSMMRLQALYASLDLDRKL